MLSRLLRNVAVNQGKVGADGRASNIGIKESSLKNPAVEACLVSVAEQWRMAPPPGGGTCEVVYPLRFSQDR